MDYNCCPMSAPILVVKFFALFFFVSPLEMMILNSIENAVVKFPNKKKKKKTQIALPLSSINNKLIYQ